MTTMQIDRAVVEQALEALEDLADCGTEAWSEQRPCVQIGREAITALRAALAQQDEPVLVQGELPPRYVARSPIQAEPVEPVATLTAQRDALLGALNDIANTDPVDAALDPQRAVRIARAAIRARTP